MNRPLSRVRSRRGERTAGAAGAASGAATDPRGTPGLVVVGDGAGAAAAAAAAGDPGDAPGAAPHDTAAPADPLREVLDLICEGVIVIGPDGEVFRNAPAESLLGSGAANALMSDAIDEMAALAATSGDPQERRLDLISPSRRNLIIRCYPKGEGKSVVVVEDVSDRQRLEAIRRDFVANVSHELKTPVGALSLLAETLDGEEDAEVVIRLAGRIGTEAERLVRIIDELLDLSRIEANESAQTEKIPVDSLVRQAVEALIPVAVSLDIELRISDLPAGVTVEGDRRDLVSAVGNLVDNAVKYSEPGSPVTVDVDVDGGRVNISVTDQGMGIPARDLERIFERFYRVDRARSRLTGGTGLGLSIVRHVAVNHGGTVEVRSAEGQGSTFVLRLPAAAGSEDTAHHGGQIGA